jgi:hypothetical protein
MTIKHIIFGIASCGILSAGSLLFTGCSLDQFPHNAVSSKNLTEEDCELLLTGLYNIVQYKPTNNGYAAFDICGGDLIRAGASSTGSVQQLIRDLVTPDSGFISGQWNGYYTALYQINELLVALNAMPAGARRDEMLGIASFFRGLLYFDIVSRWGEVPILEKPTTDDVAASSESDGWACVERNLQTAIDLAPEFTSRYEVSRQAAQALMARVKLVMGKTDEARILAEGLITCGYFSLDGFDKIFRGKDNSEEIFTFSNRTDETSVNLSGALYYSRSSENGGSYVYMPTREIIDMYAMEDLRKDISVAQQGSNDVINKYPGGELSSDPLPIVRLAEMYLISAECYGRSSNGLARLNELREKRGLLALPMPADDEAFLSAVLEERRKEFLAENHRWFDLVRTKRFESTLSLEHKYSRFPIPSREISLNDLLHQNSWWANETVE